VVFYRLQHYYKRWLNRDTAKGSVLEPLYGQAAINGHQRFTNTKFLVVDCEMSGLDVKQSQLLSIGWVLIEKGRIVNASAKHLLIHADKGAGDSTIIHGLHDSTIAGAKSVAAVLMLLIKQMQDSVLVFHHAPIDIQFLQSASESVFRCPLLFSYVDTMALEKRRQQMQGKHYSLRLSESRKRYGLGSVQQHNALADALATAELFLAQTSYIDRPENLKLKSLAMVCA